MPTSSINIVRLAKHRKTLILQGKIIQTLAKSQQILAEQVYKANLDKG